MTLEDLAAELRRFATDRDWQQFHTPKNLAISLAVEVGELLEHFQWGSDEEVADRFRTPEGRAAISEGRLAGRRVRISPCSNRRASR